MRSRGSSELVIALLVLFSARAAHAQEPDLDEAALRRFSYDDPTNAILSVPGVHVRPGDPWGIRLAIGTRGLRDVALLEDGVPSAPAPYSAPAAVWLPLWDRVQAVRLVKAPADEGRAAVDLATREIPKGGHRGSYDLALGRFLGNREHVAIGAGGESVGFVLEGMRLDTSGFQKLDNGGDAGFTRNEFMGKARWSPDPRAEIVNDFGVKFSYGDEGSNLGALGLTDADFASDPDRRYAAAAADRIESRRFGAQISHELRVSPRVSITTVAYRNDMTLDRRGLDGVRGASLPFVLTDPESPGKAAYRGALTGARDLTDPSRDLLRGAEHHAFVSQGVQSRVKAEARTGPLQHRFAYGVRAHYDEDARTQAEQGLLVFSGVYLPDGGPAGTASDEKAYTYAAAMWAVDAVTIGDVTIAPSVRVEAIHGALRDSLSGATDARTYREVLPGASVQYTLFKDLAFVGGVQRGFLPQLAAAPETHLDWEGGARWTPRGLRVEALGFYDTFENLVPLEGAGGLRARAGGVEWLSRADLELPQGYTLPVRFTYTYTFRELRDTGEPIPFVPEHQAAGAVGLETADWGADVAGTFVSAMSEGLGKQTESRFVVDASARYRVVEHLDLYALGRNLTNDRYVATRLPLGARPGAPLSVLVGARGEF